LAKLAIHWQQLASSITLHYDVVIRIRDQSMQPKFDRAAEDLGNSIHLEHVNVQVPDQHLATLFYVSGLGLTRDPYLMTSDDNMWVNVGRSQFHLPSGKPQVLRGHTGLVISGRNALLDRLASVAKKLEGTKFAFREHNDHVEATCPWGNRVRCYEPDAARFGRITLGIPYVEFEVPAGTAKGICEFYPKIMGMPAELRNGDATLASVKMGNNQHLKFRETDRPQPEYDGHHVQMYITNFSGPYRELSARGLIYSEDNQYQYRFRDIVDLADGKHLFTIEHEVRSATHPMYLRPLINRNPSQTNRTFASGHDQWLWAMGPDEYDRR
jgi:catechol-2,3-dioxygenase